MNDFEVLKELGLSKTEVRCYVCLLEHGPATVRQLAKRMKLPQTNLYGMLNRLADQGFVDKTKITTLPTLFMAQPLNRALREHYMYQRRLVLGLCRKLGISPPPALPIIPRIPNQGQQ